MLPIVAPFPIYTDLDGKPLDDGSIYYGVANTNPVTSPVAVFWDVAGTQPAVQPIKVLSGYPVHFGTPANIYTATTYSIAVYDKKGRLVYYAADSSQFDRLATYVIDIANQTDSSKGSSLVGYKLNAANSVGRTVNSKLSEFVSVKDFGAVGDGVTSDTTAFVQALAFANTIVVPAGQYRINSNISVVNGKRLQFRDGASLTIDAGVTVTFGGQVEAGIEQLFFGSGVVLGLRFVRPEWWGATRAGVGHDDAPAFQKAQTCMEASTFSDGSDAVLMMRGGDYGIASQVVFTPSPTNKMQWIGQGGNTGTRLVAMFPFTGGSVLKLQAVLANSSGCSCTFQSFRVVPISPGTPAAGIIIGDDASFTLSGGDQESCLFEDVNVLNFPICWKYSNARLFAFRRCSGWVDNLVNGKCLQIISTVAGQFTGDCDFTAMELVAQSAGSLPLEITSAAFNAQTAGIRFHACIFYYGTVFITSTGGGRVFDIWFTGGWQCDAVKTQGFVVSSAGANSHTNDINFFDGYWVGNLTANAPVFNITASAGGRVTTISIVNNYLAQFWGDAITLTGVDTIHVRGNRFVEPAVNGGSLVNMFSTSNINITDNTFSRLDGAGTISYLVTNTGGSNYYAIRSNLGGGFTTSGTVNDATPGAQKIVDGNF